MPYMYIVECSDGSYYTGSTWDLERRLEEHNGGPSSPRQARGPCSVTARDDSDGVEVFDYRGAHYTAKRQPVKLVYYEYYSSIKSAFEREKQVQGWAKRKKKALIDSKKDELIEFSRNYTQYPKSKIEKAN